MLTGIPQQRQLTTQITFVSLFILLKVYFGGAILPPHFTFQHCDPCCSVAALLDLTLTGYANRIEFMNNKKFGAILAEGMKAHG